MDIKAIFSVAIAVIGSLGGGGVIVWGLSSWLGKVWANRIMEKERLEFTQQLEDYKSKLAQELDYVGAIQNKALYISKSQYDNEYRIYQEIWDKLYKCIVQTTHLYPVFENVPSDKEGLEAYNLEKYHTFIETYNLFSTAIDCYAPFYKEDFYQRFVEIRKICNEIGIIFKTENFDRKYNESYKYVRNEPMCKEDLERTRKYRGELKDLQESLRIGIRNYLNSLRLTE